MGGDQMSASARAASMSTPAVSICLTTYNRGAALPRTVESLLSQSWDDFELIISDDCSTDGTEGVCLEWLKRDRRVKYFRNERNLRMPGNLNAAIGRAVAPYIANVHDGDLYDSSLIEKWKHALDSMPAAPFVFNGYRTISDVGAQTLYREPFEARVPGAYILSNYLRTCASCVWGTVMGRRGAYVQAGGFNPSFGFLSDVDMWLTLARGADIAYVPEPLITIAPREAHHPYRHESWQLLFWQFAIYKKHLRDCDRYLSDAGRYREQYSNLLRRRFLRAMTSLLRHRQWARVGEGIAIWRDSDDAVLRSIGRALGLFGRTAAWYGPQCWMAVQ
jgi:glycosyltransferase involved in cell wall biosynthesis